MPMNEATKAQILAADPRISTWLSANAGSGKTRVLTDRVARLLLDGARPEHILCLTYTKAAANEMKNRLLANLGKWSMLGDEKLSKALAQIGVPSAKNTPDLWRKARTMFACAIEAPGGIKIQTFHAFCTALLRQFPLEAGISPDFTELDENMSKQARMRVLEKMAEKGQSMEKFFTLNGGIHLKNTHQQKGSGTDLESILEELIKKRDVFVHPKVSDNLMAALGVSPDKTRREIMEAPFRDIESAFFDEAIEVLRAANAKTMTDLAEGLSQLDFTQEPEKNFTLCTELFLTKKHGVRKNFPTLAVKNNNPEIFKLLTDLMDKFAAAKQALMCMDVYEKTRALYDFGKDFLQSYQAEKTAHGWLDFDDLILKTQDLLIRSEAAAWVLYRLDGRIDHILVDEGQDTSPRQWKIISLLIDEIVAGEGAHGADRRSLFVVGDPKQSIYSFQGAEPAAFSTMSNAFGKRFAEAKLPFAKRELLFSFRSSMAVLNVVDKTFDPFKNGDEGKGMFGALHRAFKENLPGRVDLWPLIEAVEKSPSSHWTEPVDLIAPQTENVRLAQKIAEEIKEMIGQSITDEEGKTRPITPGDVLILTRTRGPLFYEIIRAFKGAGLPVAGVDRLRVTNEMAVKDLVAFLKFLALPQDDLSLASVLRSPLFGWDEQMLFELAHPRGKATLFQSLSARRDAFFEAFSQLDDLLKVTDFLRPYELLQKILIEQDGRRKILARLGTEAEESIDALLDLALEYEHQSFPSLDGFLAWLAITNAEVKRQVQRTQETLRIMTIHGAKGLESPIVILPETLRAKRDHKSKILPLSDGGLCLKPSEADGQPDLIADEIKKALAYQEKEYRRLLYVAMTRAEQWLIVAGCWNVSDSAEAEKKEKKKETAKNDWYFLVESAMKALGADENEAGLRFEVGTWKGKFAPAESGGSSPHAGLIEPKWFREKASPAHEMPHIFKPSKFGGLKVERSEQHWQVQSSEAIREAARLEGSFFHLALEYIGDAKTKGALKALRARAPKGLEVRAEDLIAEAQALIDNPDFAFLFGTNTLAEVALCVLLPDFSNAPFLGVIDRLFITPQKVTAVDFKTSATIAEKIEDVPEGFLCQMGAYHAMLEVLYPGREIEIAILWSKNHTLMRLPAELARAALCKAQFRVEERLDAVARPP